VWGINCEALYKPHPSTGKGFVQPAIAVAKAAELAVEAIKSRAVGKCGSFASAKRPWESTEKLMSRMLPAIGI